MMLIIRFVAVAKRAGKPIARVKSKSYLEMLPLPVTMASPGLAPGIHVFLPSGCKDAGWLGAQTSLRSLRRADYYARPRRMDGANSAPRRNAK
jgi:hypothetical protein